MLRTVFGNKTAEMTGGWRKLRNEEHNFYLLPNIVMVIKSRGER
jgi:hypothetical protein